MITMIDFFKLFSRKEPTEFQKKILKELDNSIIKNNKPVVAYWKDFKKVGRFCSRGNTVQSIPREQDNGLEFKTITIDDHFQELTPHNREMYGARIK